MDGFKKIQNTSLTKSNIEGVYRPWKNNPKRLRKGVRTCLKSVSELPYAFGLELEILLEQEDTK